MMEGNKFSFTQVCVFTICCTEDNNVMFSFKKIDTVFRRVEAPFDMISPNEWIALSEGKG